MIKKRFTLTLMICLLLLEGCKINYSMSGSSTSAKNISFEEFYNNTDLGPANMGPTFTNGIKDYFIRNSNLSVVSQEGELQMSGEISDFKLTPIAPTSTGNPDDITSASSTRLTITVKVTYIDTLNEEMSFKDRSFSFFKDFTNDQDFSSIEESYTNQIFERIINDIFNASVANW